MICNNDIIDSIHAPFLKMDLPIIQIGDIIRVGLRIIEGNKERLQYYEGTVIGKNNDSINTTLTVQKVFDNISIEKILLIHSPKVASIKILRSSKTRRSKLYFLRSLRGKASRLKQNFKKK